MTEGITEAPKEENEDREEKDGDPEEKDEDPEEKHDDPGAGTQPWQRHRFLKTAAIFMAYIYASITYSIIGPSMVSLEVILETTTKYMSAGITGNALGYLAGAIVCGLVYRTLNKELLFAVSILAGGGAFVLTAYSRHLVTYVGTMIVHGLFMSVIDTGGQSYVLKLWERRRFSRAMLQTFHTMWAVGATVGPFILHPFLADIHTLDSSLNETSVTENITSLNDSMTGIQNPNEELKVEVLSFRTAFLITAAALLLASSLFFVSFVLGTPTLRDKYREKQKVKPDTEVTSPGPGNNFRLKFLMLLAALFFTFVCIETLPSFYLGPFVVNGMGLENHYGSLITSIFWGANLISHCMGIPMSMYFTPRQLISAHLLLTLVGFSLMFLASYHFSIVWIAAAVTGFGVATTFASIILFAEEYIEITGSVSSGIIASSSVAGMVCPLLTGYLMDEYTHLALAYVCFGSTVFMILVYLGTSVYCRKYGTRRNLTVQAESLSTSIELQQRSTCNETA